MNGLNVNEIWFDDLIEYDQSTITIDELSKLLEASKEYFKITKSHNNKDWDEKNNAR